MNCAVAVSRRADACAVAFAMVFPAVAAWVYFVLLADAPTAIQQAGYLVGKSVFVFPLVWVLAVQRRPLRLRLPGPAGLLEGLLFGLLVVAGMLLLYYLWLKPEGYFQLAAEEVRKKLVGFGLNGLWQFVAFGAFVALAHSFLEEYYWRWFVFGQLRPLTGLGAAIVLSALAFMGHHVILLGVYFGWFSAPHILFSAGVAVGGAVWAWIYHRSGSLYGPWLSHLLVDAAIFVIGYDLVPL